MLQIKQSTDHRPHRGKRRPHRGNRFLNRRFENRSSDPTEATDFRNHAVATPPRQPIFK
jgi:hypothetical protein